MTWRDRGCSQIGEALKSPRDGQGKKRSKAAESLPFRGSGISNVSH